MLRLLVLLLLVGSVSTGYSWKGQDPPPPSSDYFPNQWKVFASPAGRFSVRFPGEPSEATKEYDSDQGKLTLHSWHYGSAHFITYDVDYRDYPLAPDADEIKSLLAKVRENRLMGLEGKMRLISARETRVDNHPAVLLETEYMGEKRLRELHVINGKRHYDALVITFSNHGGGRGIENAYEKIATAFLTSFHVTGDPR